MNIAHILTRVTKGGPSQFLRDRQRIVIPRFFRPAGAGSILARFPSDESLGYVRAHTFPSPPGRKTIAHGFIRGRRHGWGPSPVGDGRRIPAVPVCCLAPETRTGGIAPCSKTGMSPVARFFQQLSCLVLLFWTCCSAPAQIQQAWVARYNNGITNGTNQAVKMALDSAGNIIVTGRFAEHQWESGLCDNQVRAQRKPALGGAV